MRFIISFMFFTFAADIRCTKTEIELQADATPKTTLNKILDISNLDTTDQNIQLNSLWINNPLLQLTAIPAIEAPRRVFNRPSFSLTKLSKSLTDSFDPFFSKDNFEPFEKRSKPIMLVAFRKNGLFSHTNIKETLKSPNVASSEVAELQSPFNDVSHFWINGPRD